MSNYQLHYESVNNPAYKSPYPWFGGKSTIMPDVWERFGNVKNFVDPFFGSNAALLSNPFWTPESSLLETVNDADGFVANFWRAVQSDPEAVVHYADNPVFENDLHARHIWLVNRRDSFVPQLEGDPDWYDAKIAGWWVWGAACWIGSGFCSGNGPWQSVDGQLVNLGNTGMGVNRQRVHLSAGRGVNRQLVHLGNAGRGVNRKLVHLGDAGRGVNRKRVHLGNAGRGVNRQRVHLGNAGQGEAGAGECGLLAWIQALQERLRRVRVCCGDWSRVCGPTPTFKNGLTAVFLDPPYSEDTGRNMDLYRIESGAVAADVRRWAIENGNNPLMRIALFGYADEHDIPEGWTMQTWSANGGYGVQGDGPGKYNRHREVIWYSPHCLKAKEQVRNMTIFDFMEVTA